MRRGKTDVPLDILRMDRSCHLLGFNPLHGIERGKNQHEAYNQVIETVAGRYPDVHRVDIHQPFLGHGLYCSQFWRKHYDAADPHYWYQENVEDPNDRGYDALRRIFLNEISEALSRQ